MIAAGCGRVLPRPEAQPAPAAPEFEVWGQEARGVLSDTLQALRTFDSFHAYRVSTTDGSSMRLGSELAWDPPIGAAWDEATHVARGLRGRAEQLFLALSSAQMDPGVWREQRAAADAAYDLVDLGSVVAAYRDRLDRLGGGDASGALDQLDKVWAHWEASAARWQVTRSEAIGCRS